LTDEMAHFVPASTLDRRRASPNPHPTHNHLERTLAYIDRLRPRRALLTLMDNSMTTGLCCANFHPM
jgi:phosphoribosyl 1,2-cyclic phosphodiesterase